ncbi:MAG: acyl-CoA dehydratase activase [Bacillota bacterium]
MIVAGCDVGSLTAKAVIMDGEKILAAEVIRATTMPERSAGEVMEKALAKAGLSMKDIDYCVGTGYGRKHIPFVNAVESEIVCHGRGAIWFEPSVRTVVDIGGQDAKAIRIDEKGNVLRYVYNDKCASGTGRFLEIMADAMEIKLEDMGELSFQSTNPVTISNQCVVFAETEIISLINEGRELPDIVRGLHRAMANRAAALAKSIGVETDVAMTGGVAKNPGILRSLEKAMGVSIKQVKNPQINGALGAALIARDSLMSK